LLITEDGLAVMEIQPFAKNQWHLGQTIIVDQTLWFKGKDVANSLEYARTRDALQKHVDPEDKLTFSELAKSAVDLDGLSNQQPHELYINESGLYSLALRSTKPEAKAFKRWITCEVLPAIRKHGHDFASTVAESACRMDCRKILGADALELADALLAPMEKRLLESMRKEIQRTHPWDFHKNAVPHTSLLEVGVIAEGELLTELDNDEHVVRVTDFLKERLTPRAWDMHGKKLKNLFATELKKRKIEECESGDKPLFIARAQGEYRPIYTEADTELMTNVFMLCKRRFHNIVTRDEALLKTRRKQRRIEDYFTTVGDTEHRSLFRAGENGAPASGATGAEDVVASPADGSYVLPFVGHADAEIAIHRDAISEAPAELRLRAKRGDSHVRVCA
jgi:prophage antirepressor-like protein